MSWDETTNSHHPTALHNALPPQLDLGRITAGLAGVPGVVGTVLGGSRARGTHTPDSDVDLGLYYRGDVDTGALSDLAKELAGPDARVTRQGEWGPWVDGGGWLTIDGVHVDWIYRDLDRVRDAWVRAQRGVYTWNTQAGHPLGVPDFAYVGELAHGIVLDDPSGELGALRSMIRYPAPLARALVENLWEADFLVDIADKGVSRNDTAYVALCLSRSFLLCAHALHGHEQVWLVNEKGAIASAGQLDSAPRQFEQRVTKVLAHVGSSPIELARSIAAARSIVQETRSAASSSARSTMTGA
ncbi:nucleotidyltransferase domain-containing protein [Lapillicoccus sp.]|uniref:nucleotidyltransferase domain-containing protein n=1 Tax=Lapillicoccus sp. TaxID=1909287 RepID=UPI0032642EAE